MNSLAYFKLNRFSCDENVKIRRRAWIFTRVTENESRDDAAAKIRAFRAFCKNAGFNIIGETVFVGSEMGAVRFIDRFVTKRPYVDCMILPTLHAVASDQQSALEVVDMINANGVEVITWVDGAFQEIRSTVISLRAFFGDEICLD